MSVLPSCRKKYKCDKIRENISSILVRVVCVRKRVPKKQRDFSYSSLELWMIRCVSALKDLCHSQTIYIFILLFFLSIFTLFILVSHFITGQNKIVLFTPSSVENYKLVVILNLVHTCIHISFVNRENVYNRWMKNLSTTYHFFICSVAMLFVTCICP